MHPRQAAITFSHVSKHYSNKHDTTPALSDVSFSISVGEIFGIVGESGAGKSTLLNLCIGLERASSGEVRMFETDLGVLSERSLRQLRRKVGVVFQGFNLLSNITVSRNVELPARLQGHRSLNRTLELLDFVGLADSAHKFPAQLSGGERQRVAIARSLIVNPQLLLFDEPTSALDVSTRHDILQLIRKAQREFGATVVLVSHELEAVKAVCERAALIEQGKLLNIVQVSPQKPDERQNYLDHARKYLSA